MTAMKESILALRAEGKSYNDIVELLGCAKSTVSYWCGVDQQGKTAQRQRDKRGARKRYVQQYKQDRPCADCGVNYPYWVMDLDHVTGTKVLNVSNMLSDYSMEEIKAEVEKCEVVCANCHRQRTHQRLLTSGHNTLDGVV